MTIDNELISGFVLFFYYFIFGMIAMTIAWAVFDDLLHWLIGMFK